MITFVTGNFFDFEADIRVNTVNCVGVMGAGVALQFKQKYPRMFDEYARECNVGNIKVGKPHVWRDNNLFNHSPVIINFPTKDDWKNPSEYDYVEKGLVWLRNYLIEKGDVTITVPALGCGHGGLDWEKVRKMITDYLENLDAKVLVFEPASSTNKEISGEELAELQTGGILKLSPNDNGYPRKLVGKSAIDIYFKGDTDSLNGKLFSVIVDTKATDREKSAVVQCIEMMPQGDFIYLLSYNGSFEIDLVKTILKKEARVILVLPYGILNLKVRKDLMPLWDDKKISILSISKPKQSWSGYENINSLKFRIKTSDVILITNYETMALEKLGKEFKDSKASMFYINYWVSKNEFLSQLNATQIGRDKETHQPNIKILYKVLEGDRYLASGNTSHGLLP